MPGFFPFVFFLACFEKPYVLEGFSGFIRPPFLQFIDNWRTMSRNKQSRLRHTQESLLLLSVADKDKDYLICSNLFGRRVPFWGCQYSIDRRSVHDKPALLDNWRRSGSILNSLESWFSDLEQTPLNRIANSRPAPVRTNELLTDSVKRCKNSSIRRKYQHQAPCQESHCYQTKKHSD